MIVKTEPADTLVPKLSLGEGHQDQERAVAAALRRFIIEKHRGIVLADEVGFGKTYEALAIISQLCAYERERRRSFERALVLCKSSLVRKWEEETSATHSDRGFPRYLPSRHPARTFFFENKIHCVDSRATARELRSAGVRGQALEGRNQVRPGLYIVNEKLLQEEKRKASPLLRQIWRTRWDIIVVDEAHHYARGNRPMFLFAPDGDLRNYDQRQALEFDRIIALTATPFELTPTELVKLLSLVNVRHELLDIIERGLANFVRSLDRFFDMRDRTPVDPLRQRQVALLQHLRDDDALDAGETDRGLQSLLRQFLIRNTKLENERRYFLIERGSTEFESHEFRKLDEDLQQRVRQSPLIPFETEHTLFYLELRDLIAADIERKREGDRSRTFIPMELSQGLSSYRQIAQTKLLTSDLEQAVRLRTLVHRWNRSGKLHPKVAALRDIIRDVVDSEVRKVAATPDGWFSKVLVFNKLIRGTAPQLTEVLGAMLEAKFEQCLDDLLRPMKISREELARKVRRAVDERLDDAGQALRADPTFASWTRVPEEFEHEDFARHRGRLLLNVFREPLRRRAVQPLALIDLVIHSTCDEAGISAWVESEITSRVVHAVRLVIDRDLHAPDEDEPREALLERAERDLIVELEESKSIQVVGRFDGENARDREAHRRNFNRRHNPFVLLVGQVGEEGIDLQEQCRYVIHYDLEWNPARMEQREGRVDRIGWGRASEGFIDVKFLLLKGTYEERIFHTVMQRDQWFQVLMGSKKRVLGTIPENSESEIPQDRIASDEPGGTITESEKARVMLDLRPE